MDEGSPSTPYHLPRSTWIEIRPIPSLLLPQVAVTEALARAIADSGSPRGKVQLLEQVRDVSLGCAHRNAQCRGDLHVRVATPQQAEDGPLPVGEHIQYLGSRYMATRRGREGDRRVEHAFAGMDPTHRS